MPVIVVDTLASVLWQVIEAVRWTRNALSVVVVREALSALAFPCIRIVVLMGFGGAGFADMFLGVECAAWLALAFVGVEVEYREKRAWLHADVS